MLLTTPADELSVPKADPADSFVLHAPLEVMARVGLLPFVDPARRDDALAMIDALGRQYADAGAQVPEPAAVEVGDPAAAAAALLAALRDGDLEEGVVTSLAAAGHAPIGFALLARVQPTLPTTLLRGTLQNIARRPDWHVSWHLHVAGDGVAGRLHEALRAAPFLGVPGSHFIHPLMSQVQDSGVAADVLAPVLATRYDTVAAARTLSRIAAWSMVHDDPAVAPYGWSHALTMPQAVMSMAGAGVQPRTALAVAATFTLGFRAAYGSAPLPAAIDAGSLPDASVTEIATAAALHEDAHLVKYALACLHAADDDSSHRPLYLSAAARLVDLWGAWPA
jgi:hypothetical protein